MARKPSGDPDAAPSPTSPPEIRPIAATAAMGPMEARPTMPKPLSSPSFFLVVAATPRPKAMIKGTVTGPVVAPPESKAMPTKVGSTKAQAMKTKI